MEVLKPFYRSAFMDKVQTAVELFESGYSCSQSVAAAFAEDFGLSKTDILKIAAGLGGGLRMGSTCGALVGAFMILGLKFGATDPTDKESKGNTYQMVELAAKEFRQKFSTTSCQDLIGFNLGTPDAPIKAKQPGAFDKCPEYVAVAAEIVEQILDSK